MKNKKIVVIKEYPDSEKLGSEYFLFDGIFWMNKDPEKMSKVNILSLGVPEKYPDHFKIEDI